MSPEDKAVYAGRLHLACREIRLAVAVLDKDDEVPPDEATVARLANATEILAYVTQELRRAH